MANSELNERIKSLLRNNTKVSEKQAGNLAEVIVSFVQADATPAQAEPSDALPEQWHTRTNDLSDAGCMAAMKAEIVELLAYAKQAIEATRGGVVGDADRGNIELVVARLEQIVGTEGEYADNLVDLAKDALPCARAIESRILGQQGGGDAADAARYRWLRSGEGDNRMPHITQFPAAKQDGTHYPQIRDVGLDAAIDAAIQAQAGDAKTTPGGA